MKKGRPSIIDVARRAGVSSATVSHVINGSRKVCPATRARVEEAIAALDYRVNVLARNLRVGQSRVIAFVVASLTTDFFLAVARGIESELSEQDWQLVLVNSNEQVQTEQRQIRFLRDQLIAGLIIVPTTDDHRYLEEILPSEVPLVFVDRQPSMVRGDSVVSTNREGAYEGISHLIRSGHRKIGIIVSFLGISTTDERLTGYREALRDHGIPKNERYITYGTGTPESGYAFTGHLLNNTDITALFITNDLMTTGGYRYIIEHRISVPDRLAVIAFDDGVWATMASPRLSVIAQQTEELGRTAATLMLERIATGGQAPPYRHVRIPTRMILRESC
ncbi:MAG: LacI family transcriptional regulator [Spirochaetaceae bacterium]|nr:MAG: LacI family transcriptional regulator [Spirochaetaceae bacterium]